MTPSYFDDIQVGKSSLFKRFKSNRDASSNRLEEINPFVKFDPFRISRKLREHHTLLFSLVLLISFFLFAARAFDLQILKSEEYQMLAQKNRLRTYSVPAPRGVIYDRNGEVIAQNKPSFNLVLNVSRCSLGGDLSLCRRIIDEVIRQLPEDCKPDRESILEQLEEPGVSTLVLIKDLEKDTILSLESQALISKKLPAVDVLIYPSRDYLYAESFSHLLGYTGLSSTSLTPKIEGKSGIEQFYNDILSGISGERIIQVNSQNENIQEFDTKDPVPGDNITLFADIGLQKLAYRELKKFVEDPENSAEGGVIVAQDPQTGGILALVNYPSFDAQKMVSNITSQELSELQNQENSPFFNRAIGGAYPPGSTFKMVMASAVLEEEIVGPHFTINDPGYISVNGYVFRNWKLDGHGEVDLLRAIQVSNDTYFYTVGGGYGGIKGLGIDKISEWSKKFGFGQLTGIDIPGEVPGFVPDGNYKDWYLGDTYISSIGQGDFLATPLQTNMVTSYFANGRELVRPRVVKSIEDEETEKEILAKDLVSQRNIELVREGLRRAVSPGGTGYPVFDFPDKYGVTLAGKTGTSEYISPEGEERTHAWFTVWGPLENAEISLTVFLEGGGGGSDDAAPIARTLLDYWFADKID